MSSSLPVHHFAVGPCSGQAGRTVRCDTVLGHLSRTHTEAVTTLVSPFPTLKTRCSPPHQRVGAGPRDSLRSALWLSRNHGVVTLCTRQRHIHDTRREPPQVLILLRCSRLTCQSPIATLAVDGTISGLMGACPAVTFMLGTTKVLTDSTTTFSDGTCQQLANGGKVEVKGSKQPDGSIKASELSLDRGD